MSKISKDYIKTGVFILRRDNSKGYLDYCLLGVRHEDGVKLAQAQIRNMGDQRQMLRERNKQQNCKAKSIEAVFGVGTSHSSEEALVMREERRTCIVQLIQLNNL
jgi:hypothetical protein